MNLKLVTSLCSNQTFVSQFIELNKFASLLSTLFLFCRSQILDWPITSKPTPFSVLIVAVRSTPRLKSFVAFPIKDRRYDSKSGVTAIIM